jgi:hypothetical protein
MALNYKRTGQSRAAFRAVGIGVLIDVVITIIACVATVIPQYIWTGVGIAIALGYRQQATILQGPMVSAHLRAGGRKGSPWAAFGIAILCVLLYVVVFAGIYVAFARH